MSKFEVIRCSSCGSPHVERTGDNIGKCSHCGATMLLPRKNEEIIALLNAAYVYRENYNYDLAIKSYQFILEKDSNELSAYEGILLSKYGIEYVKDSYSGKLVPTCHRAHFKSIFEDDYYKTLITLASEEQQKVIEQKAKDIDKLQKAIERQLKNEQAYDIFISYKATDSNGDKTEDSIIAREIYEELTKKNYKVFLAEKSLEDRLGSEYEPIIFKALHTSKVFILVGTSKENVEANWVRNEWSRFIDRIKNNEELPKGCFIPVFKDMNPYDMPKINNTFVQSVDAGKIGYLVTLVDGVTKILKPEKEQKVLATFDNIDNFAEFERIKKEKKRELKKKRWEELKKSKGAKKWLYMMFLYSPYVFGLFAIIMSCVFKSHFRYEPEFLINIIAWSITVILTILTICVHIPKFGGKTLFNIVFPVTLIVIATIIYNVIIIPKTTDGLNYNFWDSCFYEKGVVFSYDNNSGQEWEDISGLIDNRYKESVKTIDGKKTLVLPNKGKRCFIRNVSIVVPEEIEVIVLPKNAEYVYLNVRGNNLKEIYSYGLKKQIAENYYDYLRIDVRKFSNTIQNYYQNYIVYYENEMPYSGDLDSSNAQFIQKDSEFYD